MSNVRSAVTASPMAKPSVMSTAVEHKAFAPAAQQKPAQSSVPPTPESSPSSSDVRRALLGARRKHMSVVRPRRGHHKSFGYRTRFRDDMYRDRRSHRINPRVADYGKVTRTYRTANIGMQNVFEQDNISFAWSFSHNTTEGPRIMLGGPVTGSVLTNSWLNNEFAADFANFGNVFRYYHVKKLSIHVEKLPLWTTMPATVVFDGVNAANEQLGNPGNILGPGRFLHRPWALESGVCDYTNGELVGDPWQDNIKYRSAVTSSACSGYGGVFSQTVTPMSQFATDMVQGNSKVPAGGVDYQVRYQVTPPCEINSMTTNVESVAAGGGVFVWSFPSSAEAANNQLRTNAWFEVEVEYYGLDIPIDPSVAATAGTTAGPEGALAQLGLVDIEKLKKAPRHAKPPPAVVFTPAAFKDDDMEMPDLKKLNLKR